jgi:hypothetical protein
MQTAFYIYIRAVFIYAALTLPALFMPLMYLISVFYVLMYGWFAWGLFSMIYLFTDKARMNLVSKMILLTVGVPAAVALAYQMIEIIGDERSVWESSFVWFPIGAVVAGWISMYSLKNRIAMDCPGYREQDRSLEVNE